MYRCPLEPEPAGMDCHIPPEKLEAAVSASWAPSRHVVVQGGEVEEIALEAERRATVAF